MVEELTSLPVLRLLSYWRVRMLAVRRRGGALPSRSDIEPARLSDILPHLFLLDLARRGDETVSASTVRFRLCGTAAARFIGLDPTGQTVAELTPPELCAGMAGALSALARNRRPVTYRGIAYSLETRPFDPGTGSRPVWSAFEFALAPLADADGRLSMIVGALNCGATARVASGKRALPLTDRLQDGALSVV
jgi:hypothetical protein